MIINRKIKRTMMESKSQYVGSLVLIILSCVLFTLFNLLSVNLSGLTASFEKNYKQENASFIADKKINNIAALESKFNMSMEETKSLDYSVSNDKTLRIFRENSKVNLPAVVEGKPLSRNNILIDPAYAKANKLNIGDSVDIYNSKFNICGFVSLPNYIYPLRSESDIMNDPSSFGIAVLSKDDFNSLNKGNSSYAVRFNGDKSNLDDRMSQLKDYLKNENIIVLNWLNVTDNTRVNYVTAKLKGIGSMSSSVPVLILILTCILTGIVMWRMLKRESVIIGTLYALGYKKRDILKHYLMYPLFISLLGGIIGTVLGIITLKPMINFMISYFNMPVSSIDYSLTYISVSVLLPVVFLITCSCFVINSSLKSSPVELMRGGKKNDKVSFIERHLKLHKLSFNTKFKVREQLRSITRSIFLLLGVIMATMLLLMGFTEKNSLDYLMKDSFNDAFKYNYTYVFNSIQHSKPDKGEAFSEIPSSAKGNSKLTFAVYGVSENSQYISFKDKSGNTLNSDKVIVTRPLADKLNLKPDDTVAVVSRLDSKEYSLKVDSIAETYVGQYIYVPLDKLNSTLNFPAGSYMGIWSSDKLNIPEEKLLTVVTVDDMKKALDTMTAPLQSFIGAISFMSFLIGLIVIYVVTSLTIEENRENISLMKVLGYRKKEIYSLVLNSSTFIVILGYILGIPLLLVSLDALFKSVTKDMTISMPIKINYAYTIFGFAVIYLTYELSKLLSRRKINRVSMVEALKAAQE